MPDISHKLKRDRPNQQRAYLRHLMFVYFRPSNFLLKRKTACLELRILQETRFQCTWGFGSRDCELSQKLPCERHSIHHK